MLNFDPQAMGLLGMMLLKQSNNNNFNPMQFASLLKSDLFTQNQEPTSEVQNNPLITNNSVPVFNEEGKLPPFGDKNDILSKLKASALATYPDNPVMQQVALTQAIHESGIMGKGSELASKYNNYFGIKSKNGVNLATQEYYDNEPTTIQDSFAANPNIESSFGQYRDLLSKPRYQAVASAPTPSDAFVALQKAGYATDPQYAQKLNSVYKRYIMPLYS